MELDSIFGDLQAYKQLKPGTFQHVDELINKCRDNPSLRDQVFYTADGAIYFMRDDTPMLAITRESHNPVLNNIDDAVTQIDQEGNYRINQEEAEAAINAEDTEVFDLTKLPHLFGNSPEWRDLPVSTSAKEYEKLNSEERRLAERVYGQGDDFVQNMKMFADAGIGETQIYVLSPDYVKNKAANSPIGKALWLDDFDGCSGFEASDHNVYVSKHLHGVHASEASTETI